MSISISIGSNPQDITNLQMTEDIISFVSSLLKAEDHVSLLADKTYTQSQVDSLLNWYHNLLDILYNAGTLEEEMIPSL